MIHISDTGAIDDNVYLSVQLVEDHFTISSIIVPSRALESCLCEGKNLLFSGI